MTADEVKAGMVVRARQIDEHLAAVRRLLEEQVIAGREWYEARGTRPGDTFRDYATQGAIERDFNQALRHHCARWIEADANRGYAASMLDKTNR